MVELEGEELALVIGVKRHIPAGNSRIAL
jgi:hypothetical protein